MNPATERLLPAQSPSPPSVEWQHSMISDVPERPYPTYDELSYDDYLTKHVLPNTPFLLSAKATAHWPAVKAWRRRRARATETVTGGEELDPGSSSSSLRSTDPSPPNLPALRRYAHHLVPVANTHLRCFSEFERTELPLGEVLDAWERGDGEGKGWYIKDWHLFAGIESEGGRADGVYAVPECLRDDWLNPPFSFADRGGSTALPPPPSPPPSTSLPSSPPSHPSDGDLSYHHPNTTTTTTTTTSPPASSPPSTSASDFRFAYVGPPGTFTPLHRDVYASYSWSANVVGRKVWWLFPPDRLDGVREKTGEDTEDGEDGGDGELVFDVRDLPGEGGGIKVVQQEGEVIFIPSGWHHQVVNLDFCISLNHNFFASPTLPRIFTAMEQAQTRVENAIADVRDMIRQRLGEAPYSGPYEYEYEGSNSSSGSGWNSDSRSSFGTEVKLGAHRAVDSGHCGAGVHGAVARAGEMDQSTDDRPPAMKVGQKDEIDGIGVPCVRVQVMAWEVEWAEEVQGLLERDSGWGWKGFFETVLRNLSQPSAPERMSPSKEIRDGFVREVVERYKMRREWVVLPHLRGVVREAEALLGTETAAGANDGAAGAAGTNDGAAGAAGPST